MTSLDGFSPIRTDVIVVGAGPVGLFLACELALAGCSVRVLEKTLRADSPLKQLPFGIRGLSAPIIAAFDRRGLLSELQIHTRLKNPHKTGAPTEGPRRQVGHFAGIPFHEGDIDSAAWTYRLPSSTPTSLISEMQEIETVLTRRAETLGVTIEHGRAVTDIAQDAHGVTVYADDRTCNAQWVVGCDGARSVVRKSAGIEFAGTEPEFTGYTARVDVADPEKLKPGRNATASGMYLQSQPGFVVIQDFDAGAFHQSDRPLTREHVQEVLRRVSETDITLTALHAATTWTDRARQATRYRHGRILLAGDAAHIHAPLGGQGLNLGIGDAMNLGWKLAATVHGTAAQGLLDSFERERHIIGAQVLDWSRAQVALMRPDAGARALHAVVRDLLNTREGATYAAGRVWGVDTRFDLESDDPLAGRSVPNFEFDDGRCMGDIMHEGRWILLDFATRASLQSLASEYGQSLRYVSEQARQRFDRSCLLIRPDGVIAWTSESVPDEQSLRAAIARWLASPTTPSAYSP